MIFGHISHCSKSINPHVPLVCREKITPYALAVRGILPLAAIIRVESDFPSDALDMGAEGEESIDVEETNEIGG